MTIDQTLQKKLDEMASRAKELVRLAADLVRIDSQNFPPAGNEADCQKFVNEYMLSMGAVSKLVDITKIPALEKHHLYYPGRDYSARPNLAARIPGNGTGKSILFSGHIDTMPAAPGEWKYPPCEPSIEDGRLYGLGAFDMKAGIAAAMWVMRLISEWGWRPEADILLETVVDEEHAGANGTLANRLIGHNAEGVLLPEPSSMKLFSAHKGFRIVHITLHGTAGMSFAGEEPVNPVEYIGVIIEAAKEFAHIRRRTAPISDLYEDDKDPVPVMLPKLKAGEFSYRVPMQIPESCKLEIYWQTMPGETQEEIEQQFLSFMAEKLKGSELMEKLKIEYEFSHRWMPGTETDREHPFITSLSNAAGDILDHEVQPQGAPYPCDLFIFNNYEMPSAVLGPAGKNAHAPNEYVDLDSLMDLAKVFLVLVDRWCGFSGK